MAEEIITQTTEEIAASNIETRSTQRINELSEKVKLTSQERDEKERLLKETTEKLATLEKEKSFSDSFVEILATQPAAKDHKDEIKAKVLAGYTPEDAAFAVLGKAGKLGSAPTAAPQVAGGSATTNVTATQKSAAEMSQADRRAILEKELIIT